MSYCTALPRKEQQIVQLKKKLLQKNQTILSLRGMRYSARVSLYSTQSHSAIIVLL